MKRLLRKAEIQKSYLEILQEIKAAGKAKFLGQISQINSYAKMYKRDKDAEGEKCYYDDFIKFILRVDSNCEIIFETLVEMYGSEEDSESLLNILSIPEKEDLINYLVEQSEDNVFENFEV